MTLIELKYILATARELNYTRAAKACHVSQPTLSQAIKKFESRYRIQLFERHNQAITLTEAGKRVVLQATRVMNEVSQLVEITTEQQSQLSTPISFGAIHSVSPYILPDLIPRVKQLAPDMPMLIKEDITDTLLEEIKSAQLDVALLALPIHADSLLSLPIFQEEFYLALPSKHELSTEASISHADISQEDILLLGDGHCYREQVINACPECANKRPGSRTISGTSLETVRHMVASGLGISVVPAIATSEQFNVQNVCYRPFREEKKPHRQIALVWRKSFSRPKAISVIKKALLLSLKKAPVELLV